ncbi:hypothetical protein [Lysobacter sp. K5869]|nr:hypothetical protein [Lysobacter sp. K5869]
MTDTAALKRAIGICREHSRGEERWAVFERCEECTGEGVVEAG